jgi:predicted Zn-dependent protease
MARTNPIATDERRDFCANQTTRDLIIDLFHAGLLFEMSGAKQALQAAIVAMCALTIDEQGEALFKRELLCGRLFKLLREGVGHAGEFESA